MWIDIESGEVITAEQLRNEYEQLKQAQPTEYSYSFNEYIRNCLTRNNGTLERSE